MQDALYCDESLDAFDYASHIESLNAVYIRENKEAEASDTAAAPTLVGRTDEIGKPVFPGCSGAPLWLSNEHISTKNAPTDVRSIPTSDVIDAHRAAYTYPANAHRALTAVDLGSTIPLLAIAQIAKAYADVVHFVNALLYIHTHETMALINDDTAAFHAILICRVMVDACEQYNVAYEERLRSSGCHYEYCCDENRVALPSTNWMVAIASCRRFAWDDIARAATGQISWAQVKANGDSMRFKLHFRDGPDLRAFYLAGPETPSEEYNIAQYRAVLLQRMQQVRAMCERPEAPDDVSLTELIDNTLHILSEKTHAMYHLSRNRYQIMYGPLMDEVSVLCQRVLQLYKAYKGQRTLCSKSLHRNKGLLAIIKNRYRRTRQHPLYDRFF